METPVLQVSDFIALVNQTLDYAYPFVAVEGEVVEYNVSKGRWVFVTLKDEFATVRCFSTIYALPTPLTVGMKVRMYGAPRVHERYGFSLQVQQVRLVGEGSLQKGFELLRAKLEAEGLFAPDRKRSLSEAPRHVAVITAYDSAAAADFMKIAQARWGGVKIAVYDSYMQGDEAPESVVQAFRAIQNEPILPEVIVLIRGGGSREDLAAFSHEEVVRTVAASRVPTVVAIGHETDESLAELAADMRASTPSNAAELLFPDKKGERKRLGGKRAEMAHLLHAYTARKRQVHNEYKSNLHDYLHDVFERAGQGAKTYRELLVALDPLLPLQRGYAMVQDTEGRQVSSVAAIGLGDVLYIALKNGTVTTEVKELNETKRGEK